MLRTFLFLLLVGALAACHRLESMVERNVDNALAPSGALEGQVPIGSLFDHPDGVICIVGGELNDVNFGPAVPTTLRSAIARQLDAGPYGHMGMKVHLFDAGVRRTDAMAIHRRNPRVYISVPAFEREVDACYGPEDHVLVRRRSDGAGILIVYPSPEAL